MKLFYIIKQCGRVCHCVEYLQFKETKDIQFYNQCYHNILSLNKFSTKFKIKTNKIKNNKL